MNVARITAVVSITVWFALTFAMPALGADGVARLVKDINTTTKSSWPGWFTAVGGGVFFIADDGVHGHALWYSDGSEVGTFFVKDILTDSEEGRIFALTAGSSILFFVVDDGLHGAELWRSDGTSAGTILIKDLGTESVYYYEPSRAAVGDVLYFTLPGQLWRTDATAEGTQLLADLGTPYSVAAYSLVAAGDLVFFAVKSGLRDRAPALWVTDGSSAGTGPIREFHELRTNTGASQLTALSDRVFFAADDGIHGIELWTSDGTPTGTRLVRDISPGSAGTYPDAFSAVDEQLFFIARDPVNGRGLWRTDGTEAGTVRVSDTLSGWRVLSGGLLYFEAFDEQHGYELWRSDGTASGTRIVKDIRPGRIGSSPQSLTDLDGTLLFTASDTEHGCEIWRTDGTDVGTALVRDIRPGNPLALGIPLDPYCPGELTAAGGAVIFAGAEDDHGVEIWKTDGTTEGTQIVKDVRVGTNDSSPAPIGAVDGRLVFLADDGRGRAEWITDGTEVGTTRIDAVPAGDVIAELPGLRQRACPGTRFGDAFFFLGSGAVENLGLWRCDGNGTTRVKELFPAGDELALFGGKLFFRAWAEGRGAELWISDGTAVGTRVFVDIRRGSAGGLQYPVEPRFTVAGNSLLFVADDGLHGQEIWRTDGTEAGTSIVRDIHPGTRGSAPWPFTTVDGLLYFTADDGRYGRELWSSDGTEEGTSLVSDINVGRGGSFPAEMTRFGSSLVFAAHSDTTGTELWQSDGTDTGTQLIRDIKPGRGGSFPTGLVVSNGRVIFAAHDGVHGWEVWSSDGTPTGTVLASDLSPGGSNAFFTAEMYWNGRKPVPKFIDAGGIVAFVADDGGHGRELWVSDGTDSGTLLVNDVAEGSASSDPESPTTVDSLFFFTAEQEATGCELWVANRADLSPPCVGDCDGDWSVSVAHLVKGVGVMLGTDSLSSCSSFDADFNNALGVNELLSGVTNALEGCQIVVQRIPPTMPLPTTTETPLPTATPTAAGTPSPPAPPGPRECVRTGCSSQLCAADHIITDCRWVTEYGCLRAARCEPAADGCGFVFDRGAEAHRCLIGIGRCVFDDDCGVGEVCLREGDAWGNCSRPDFDVR